MTYPTPSRRFAAALILFFAALGVSTAVAASVDNPVIYSDDQSAGSTIQDRDPGYRPLYLVYADTQRTAAVESRDRCGQSRHQQPAARR